MIVKCFHLCFLFCFLVSRKLKYQTDKLLRLAASASSAVGDNGAEGEGGDDDDDDPLSFRPRPEAMAPWGDEAHGKTTGLMLYCQFFANAAGPVPVVFILPYEHRDVVFRECQV